MRYFLKELQSRPLSLPSGLAVPFEDVGGDMGVLATDDGFMISELDNAIARRVGGVVAIDRIQYEDLKKNSVPGEKSPPRLRHVVEALLRTKSGLQADSGPVAKGANAAGVNPATTASTRHIERGQPLEVPSTIPTPRKLVEVERKVETFDQGADSSPAPAPDSMSEFLKSLEMTS